MYDERREGIHDLMSTNTTAHECGILVIMSGEFNLGEGILNTIHDAIHAKLGQFPALRSQPQASGLRLQLKFRDDDGRSSCIERTHSGDRAHPLVGVIAIRRAVKTGRSTCFQ